MKTLDDFLEELNSYQDENTRAEILIELAESFCNVPSNIATEPYSNSNKVPACESDVYVFYTLNSDKSIKYYFSVLNPQGISAKAFAVILDQHLSNQPLEFVSKVDDDIVKKIFGNGISMGKGLGLRSMLGVVKAIANNNLGN